MIAQVREVDASVGQRLLWLLEHYRGRGGALNVPLVWRVSGALEPAALQIALDALVARHETLRTSYRADRRRLVQRIHSPMSLPIAMEDLSDRPQAERRALAAMRAEAATGIDPLHWPTRARMWRIAPDDHLFFLNIHHLASDASSNRLLGRDLGLLYDRAMGLDVELPAVAWQYADWASWQRHALAAERLARLQRYWSGKLSGAGAVAIPHPVPSSIPDPPGGASIQERVDVEPELVEELRAVARAHRATLFPVMLAIFYAHLQRASGARDLAVASLFANRSRPEVEETVGFFVNMLVLRTLVDPNQDFATLVRASRSALMGGLAHGELPYQMLPGGTLRPTDPDVGRIDDLVFHFIDAFGDERTETGLDIDAVVLPLNQTRFALELVFVLNEQECFINLRFDERRYERAWAREFLHGYVALARLLAARTDVPLELV